MSQKDRRDSAEFPPRKSFSSTNLNLPASTSSRWTRGRSPKQILLEWFRGNRERSYSIEENKEEERKEEEKRKEEVKRVEEINQNKVHILETYLAELNEQEKTEILRRLLKLMTRDDENGKKSMATLKQCATTLVGLQVESVERIVSHDEDNLLISFSPFRMSNFFTMLPSEIFQQILEYLPQAARWSLTCTCKDIHKLVRNIPRSFRLWKNPIDDYLKSVSKWTKLIHLRIENGHNISSTGIGYLSSLTLLQTLHLKDCSQMTDQGLMRCLKIMTSLNHLCIDLTSTTEHWLSILPRLKNLQVVIFRDSGTLSDSAMQHFRPLIKLRHFELNGFHNISSSGLVHFTSHLKSLRLGHSRKDYIINFPFLASLHVTGVDQIFIHGTTNLQKIYLIHCDVNFRSCQGWTHLVALQELSFIQCEMIQADSVSLLCSKLTNLQLLELRLCDKSAHALVDLFLELIERKPQMRIISQEYFGKPDIYGSTTLTNL